MTFKIKKGATLPNLCVEYEYADKDFISCILNSDIYFNMYKTDCNQKVISNRPCLLVEKESNCENCGEIGDFYILVEWKIFDTRNCGKYKGEFVISSDQGTFIAPINSNLYIEVIA